MLNDDEPKSFDYGMALLMLFVLFLCGWGVVEAIKDYFGS